MDAFKPECVASTESDPVRTTIEIDKSCVKGLTGENIYFKSAEWTADGTTVITTTADNTISTFIIPPDLLEPWEGLHHLTPYSTLSSNEPVNAVTTYPLFNLQEPSTTLVLSSIRDHPVCLSSALVPGKVASYPVINPSTESFITPHSLLFHEDGTRFIAGSNSLLSIFDVSRPGQEPIWSFQTSAKRANSLANPGMSMKGIISALAIESSGVLAAGTFTRYVGLYDSRGAGACVGVFTVDGTTGDKQIGGRGVTQLLWSSCDRYLYITERKSDGVLVYDIRQTGQLVSWLEGRNAMTNQRIAADLATSADGEEVWAGGTDGVVRVWKNAQHCQGGVKASHEWAAHDDIVSAVVVHPIGGVVATASGQRHFSQLQDGQSPAENKLRVDNSLKIWAT